MSDTHSRRPNKISNAANPLEQPFPSSAKPALSAGGMPGALLFAAGLLLAAALAGVNLAPGGKIFLEGEIAAQDVTAPRDFLIEDQESTRARKELVAQTQPPIFDLAQIPFVQMAKRLTGLLDQIVAAAPEEQARVRAQIADELNLQVTNTLWAQWTSDHFHEAMHSSIIPWLEEAYQRGVLAERRFVADIDTGVLVRDLSTGVEQLHLDISGYQDLASLMEALDIHLRDAQQSQALRRAAAGLVAPVLRPNLTLNQEASQARAASAVQAVEPVFYQIKKGEIIVRKSERVSLDQQQKMQTLFADQTAVYHWGRALGVFLIGLALAMGVFHSARGLGRRIALRDALLLASVMIVFAALAKFMAFTRLPLIQNFAYLSVDGLVFALPVAGAAGLLALFFPVQVCLFAGALLAFLCTQMLHAGFEVFLFFLVGAGGYALFLKDAQTRVDILKTAPPLMILLLGTWTALNLLHYQGMSWFAAGAAFVASGAVLSTLLLLSLSPVAELFFGYTSRFKLMELMSLEQPLLQSLMVRAPGTYHHCLIVANLAEAGARSIGANPLLAKVAALYHDIGKMKNPHYFIENQFGCENRHDKLAPSMSALILTAHVKKGVELARMHKLGPEITDLIQQHHGTRLIAYFYQKAVTQAGGKTDSVHEDDFRYPGPKPQTREAGIILLADVIEASSRTLVDPSPSRIRGHIQNLVRSTFNEGQLDESDLSLKDLHVLCETFQRILTGIFHQRIHYPQAHGNVSAQPNPKKGTAKEASLRLVAGT